MNVLLAERDTAVSAPLARLLEGRDHEVTVCETIAEGWRHFEQRQYPLVLLGQHLTDGDGLTLCRRLRAHALGDVTVVLVLVAPDADVQPILEEGADDFLTTPLDFGAVGLRLTIAERKAWARGGRRRREAALRESERRLSAVIADAPVGILALDPVGTVTHVKGRALESFGLRGSDCIGRTIFELFGESASLRGSIEQALSGASSACALEFQGQPLEVRWSPQLSPKGVVRGALGVVVGLGETARLVDEGERTFHGLYGKSGQMQVVFEQIREVARVDWTVLIEGETGTGKELVAHAIHATSNRAEQPFLAVNCAGLTDSLLASQLFGHRRGAFTGAVRDQEGLFEAADGGSLFLDEIGDISRNVQVSLLRVLETREVTRVGETQPRSVDTRIITATNRRLADAVAEGSFRADLYYRIRIARLELPPLRERSDDIPDLAWHFLDGGRQAAQKPVADIDPAAMAVLCTYPWPGNVRELKGAIEFAVLKCRGTVIARGDLPNELIESGAHAAVSDVGPDDLKAQLLSALEEAQGNRSKAARMLGISRATLYRYLSRWELGEKMAD